MLKKYFVFPLLLASFLMLLIEPNHTHAANEVESSLSTDSQTELILKDSKRRQMLDSKMTEIVSGKENRKKRLAEEKQLRLQNIEDLKAKQEQFKANRETLKTKFDELKLQKLENIKQRGLLVSARYSAISQSLYKMLEKITAIVAEKKDAGFDVSNAESMLTAIEIQLVNIKQQQDEIQSLVDGIQDLPAEDVPSSLTQIKNLSSSIKSQYETVRTDMRQLVQSLK